MKKKRKTLLDEPPPFPVLELFLNLDVDTDLPRPLTPTVNKNLSSGLTAQPKGGHGGIESGELQ